MGRLLISILVVMSMHVLAEDTPLPLDHPEAATPFSRPTRTQEKPMTSKKVLDKQKRKGNKDSTSRRKTTMQAIPATKIKRPTKRQFNKRETALSQSVKKNKASKNKLNN